MALHYNITYKHRQTTQYLPFVSILHKITSTLINTLITLVKLQQIKMNLFRQKIIYPTTILQGNIALIKFLIQI
jgi:hypothetical protein